MPISPVPELVAELAAGRMVILVDEEDRENEGDLILAADHVTPEAINFMARYGRGLICLTLTRERCERLQLAPMAVRNGTRHGTAFTVSIEAAQGVSTGISAADRARTVKAAVAREARASDLVRPGHVFPLQAQEGGVLIHHRSQNETLIERMGRRSLVTAHGTFDCTAFRDRSGGLHLALTVGRWSPDDEVLVRVHEPLSVMDLLDGAAGEHSWSLPSALGTLQEAGRGVALLLNCGSEDAAALLPRVLNPCTPDPAARSRMDLRTYGIGAQILRELGITRMKLLSSPRRMPSMAGYGLEVAGFVPSKD
jgi:3,4-dihydroxy 2-butanone 4-phosphate synthase / GTP cyclohydrolase II